MRLVTVARPTGAPNRVAHEVTARAAHTLGVPGVVSYGPVPADPSSIVVPLLLSSAHDLPVPPLGPHPLIAAAQAARLVRAGARPGTPVVMVALGAQGPGIAAHLERAVELLAHSWTGPVELATLSGPGPRPEEVLRRRVAVSPYLLSPGADADRIRAVAQASGAVVVADVVGAHRFVADLVVRRFRLGAARSHAA
ncbi:hypothetical protein GHK92_09760 [Nocardioides sp. dk4132]|uniref:sirohydrochlorin chelatase n=1 Tax=unclassified Nocardioides TaxID=2615069 RepID=UPI001294F6AD|nr:MULTISPECIES: hypothetical protein [unclassified Nocardioides]MQW76160.1 hypothetical protein [Nocardioides sp. dk4132]QGA08995.1 hypothetical protein GFH29_17515 [Nocardioides sp. dk884]